MLLFKEGNIIILIYSFHKSISLKIENILEIKVNIYKYILDVPNWLIYTIAKPEYEKLDFCPKLNIPFWYYSSRHN